MRPPFLSLDGNPYGLPTVFGLHDLHLEFVEPLAGFEDLADELVAANEDAALSVLGGVARVNADALEEVVEVGATKKDGKPGFELWRVGDYYCVATFGGWRRALGSEPLQASGARLLSKPLSSVREQLVRECRRSTLRVLLPDTRHLLVQ